MAKPKSKTRIPRLDGGASRIINTRSIHNKIKLEKMLTDEESNKPTENISHLNDSCKLTRSETFIRDDLEENQKDLPIIKPFDSPILINDPPFLKPFDTPTLISDEEIVAPNDTLDLREFLIPIKSKSQQYNSKSFDSNRLTSTPKNSFDMSDVERSVLSAISSDRMSVDSPSHVVANKTDLSTIELSLNSNICNMSDKTDRSVIEIESSVDSRYTTDTDALNEVLKNSSHQQADETRSSVDYSDLLDEQIMNSSNQPDNLPIEMLEFSEFLNDCSVEFCDSTVTSSAAAIPPSIPPKSPSLRKQHSFDMDESLGILTPDQMKEFLDSTTTNPNLDLPLQHPDKLSLTHHQCRMDQTPSPEELPLDPVDVKTDTTDMMNTGSICSGVSGGGGGGIIDMSSSSSSNSQPAGTGSSGNGSGVGHHSYHHEQQISQTDSYTKTDDKMTKSTASKVSNSFITSITSITSLDTGYQGDGEMSRPVSRGGDHSPSNVPHHRGNLITDNGKVKLIRDESNQNIQIIRRQDPMTDSDFFTESDADDIIHRGDRRAQIIDGQLYGPMGQEGENIFINQNQQQQNHEAGGGAGDGDSCMESSGIFTDIENRCCDDDDVMHQRNNEHDSDMSPDCSTDTMKSTNTEYNNNNNKSSSSLLQQPQQQQQQHIIAANYSNHVGQGMSDSTTSTINSSSCCSDEKGSAIGACSVISANTDRHSIISDVSSNACASIKSINKYEKNINRSSVASTSANRDKTKKIISNVGKQNKNDVNVALKQLNNSCSKMSSVMKKFVSLPSSVTGSDGELQENKRSHAVGNGGSVASGVLGSVRKIVPNKWDAVMNKIAVNKTAIRTPNYSEIKSKVTCGLSRRNSPRFHNINNNSNSSSNDHLQSSTKQIMHSSSKRSRTHSKDSQQSSQSDISLSSNSSPKQRINSSASPRSAKKRDVRAAITISPNDLGPPTKHSEIAKTINIKPITLQKRTTTNGGVHATASPLEVKTTPSTKNNANRWSPITKTSKDKNRLLGTTTPSPKGASSPKTTQKSSSPQHTLIPTTTTTTTVAATTKKIGTNSPTNFQKNLNHNIHQKHTVNGNGSIAPIDGGKIIQKKLQPTQIARSSVINGKIQCVDVGTSANIDNVELIESNKKVEALSVLIQYLAFHLEAFTNPHLKKVCETTEKSLNETKIVLDDVRIVCGNLEEKIIEKDEYYNNREKELQDLHRIELNKVESSLVELKESTSKRISSLETLVSETALQLEIAKNKEDELLKRVSTLSSTENELRDKVHASENEFGDRIRAAAQRERDLTDKINQLQKQLELNCKEAESNDRHLREKLNLLNDEIVVLRNTKNSTVSYNDTLVSSTHSSPRTNGCSSANIQQQQPRMLQEEIESLRCVLELKQREISDLRKQSNELQTAADSLPNAMIKISGLESRLEDLQIQLKSKCDDEKSLLEKSKSLQESLNHEIKTRNRLSLHNEQLLWKLKQNSEKFSNALTELCKIHPGQHDLLNDAKLSLYGQENSQSDISNGSASSYKLTSDSFQMDLDISPPQSPVIKGVVEKSDSVSWVLEINDDESGEALASRMVRRAGSFRSSFNEKHSNSYLSPINFAGNRSINGLSQSASAASILRQHSNDSFSSSNHAIENSTPITSTPSPSSLSSRIRSKSVSKSEPKMIARSNSSAATSSLTSSRKNDGVASSWNDRYVNKRLRNKPIAKDNKHEDRTTATQEDKMSFNKSLTNSNDLHSNKLKCRSRSNSIDEMACDGNDGVSDDIDESAFLPFRRNHPTTSTKLKSNKRRLITCNMAALTSQQRTELPTTSSPYPSVQDLKRCQQIKESAGEAMVSGANSEDEDGGSTASSDDSLLSAGSSHSSGSSHSAESDRALHFHPFLENIVAMNNAAHRKPIDLNWSEDNDHYPNESVV